MIFEEVEQVPVAPKVSFCLENHGASCQRLKNLKIEKANMPTVLFKKNNIILILKLVEILHATPHQQFKIQRNVNIIWCTPINLGN